MCLSSTANWHINMDDIILDITENKLKTLEEQIKSLFAKGENIIEYCSYPANLSEPEKIELNAIKSIVRKINNEIAKLL